MSARLRELDREVRRARFSLERASRAASMARRRPSGMPAASRPVVRSMVVDFGEPATFGAGVVTMSVDPAVVPTDTAWERAVSDALAARDEHADREFLAATFATAFEDEDGADERLVAADEDFDSDAGHEDFEEIEDHDDEGAEVAEERGEVLAQSQRRALVDDDVRFWAVARAADEARTQLANDPDLAELDAPEREDAESEADQELRRDLAELQQQPVQSPAESPAPVASAHSVFDDMTMATMFDVGTVEVTRTFDALDAELDREERARERAAVRAAAMPPTPPSSRTRALDLESTVEDLAWIQQAIERGHDVVTTDEVEPGEGPVASSPGEPIPEDTEPERSVP
jgi:hypothetical protein